MDLFTVAIVVAVTGISAAMGAMLADAFSERALIRQHGMKITKGGLALAGIGLILMMIAS